MGSERPGYVRGLDGLRAIAIVAVIMFHLRVDGAMLGWAGVQLFFVVSGFLITRILIASRGDAHPFRSFYIRRALRIFPIYYLFLFLITAMHVGAGETERLQTLPLYLTYTQNLPSVMLDTGLLATGHTWSLAIEEQFYWLWPFAVLMMPTKRLKYLIPALIIAAPVWRYAVVAVGAHPFLSSGVLLGQMDSILVGAAIAVALHFGLSNADLCRIGWGAVAVGGVATAGLTSVIGPGNFRTHTDWVDADLGFLLLSAIAILFGGLVSVVVAGSVPAVLESQPLKWTGRLSYGLYIYHIPIFFLVNGSEYVRSAVIDWPMGDLLLDLLKVALSFAVAAASWRFIEEPALRLKDRLAPPETRDEPSPELLPTK